MHACPKCGVSCACDSTACQHKCGSLVTLCFDLLGSEGEDLLLRDPRDGKTFRLAVEPPAAASVLARNQEVRWLCGSCGGLFSDTDEDALSMRPAASGAPCTHGLQIADLRERAEKAEREARKLERAKEGRKP